MRQKPTTQVGSTEQVVKDIRRATRKQYSAEEKIRIVLDGLRGEYSIAESLFYSWSKEFWKLASVGWLVIQKDQPAQVK
jgi:transposase